MLTALVSLARALGDRFIPTVARGRREYGHPRQVAAFVYAGLTAETSALWDTKPIAIPTAAALALQEADPRRTLEAIEPFPWAGPQPRYFMFERKIAGWSTAEQVAADLKGFTP
jgi:hypothetical protein